MAITTITTKGQMTLPKEIRDRLGLKPGDLVEVTLEGQRILLAPKTLHLDDITSILPKPARVVSIEEMDEAILEATAAHAL